MTDIPLDFLLAVQREAEGVHNYNQPETWPVPTARAEKSAAPARVQEKEPVGPIQDVARRTGLTKTQDGQRTAKVSELDTLLKQLENLKREQAGLMHVPQERDYVKAVEDAWARMQAESKAPAVPLTERMANPLLQAGLAALAGGGRMRGDSGAIATFAKGLSEDDALRREKEKELRGEAKQKAQWMLDAQGKGWTSADARAQAEAARKIAEKGAGLGGIETALALVAEDRKNAQRMREIAAQASRFDKDPFAIIDAYKKRMTTMGQPVTPEQERTMIEAMMKQPKDRKFDKAEYDAALGRLGAMRVGKGKDPVPMDLQMRIAEGVARGEVDPNNLEAYIAAGWPTK